MQTLRWKKKSPGEETGAKVGASGINRERLLLKRQLKERVHFISAVKYFNPFFGESPKTTTKD